MFKDRGFIKVALPAGCRYGFGGLFELGIMEWETIGRKGLAPPSGFADIAKMKQGNFTDYMRFYYLKDHTSTSLSTGLGSVRVTLNQSGSVVGHACPERSRRDGYYPFGLHNLSRPFGMPGRSNNSANRDDDQKFTGHFFEQEGDLEIYHAQARMYDPATGRFWGVDAMRSEMPSWNAYHYTYNNPVRYVDPDGNNPLRFAYKTAKGVYKQITEKQAISQSRRGQDTFTEGAEHASKKSRRVVEKAHPNLKKSKIKRHDGHPLRDGSGRTGRPHHQHKNDSKKTGHAFYKLKEAGSAAIVLTLFYIVDSFLPATDVGDSSFDRYLDDEGNPTQGHPLYDIGANSTDDDLNLEDEIENITEN